MTSARKRKAERRGSARLSKALLDRLVEEEAVDRYNESEQRVGLYTMIEDNLALPFETKVLGVPVIVQRVDLTPSEEIVAVCRRAGENPLDRDALGRLVGPLVFQGIIERRPMPAFLIVRLLIARSLSCAG